MTESSTPQDETKGTPGPRKPRCEICGGRPPKCCWSAWEKRQDVLAEEAK